MITQPSAASDTAHDDPSTPTVIRHGEKEAVRFVTPSGITAIVATSVAPELMRLLRKKLERKLRARHRVSQDPG